MDVTKPEKTNIRFGAMDVTKTYKFMVIKDVTKPCKYICFGAMYVTKPYIIYMLWGHGCHQNL